MSRTEELPIEELKINARAYNCLKSANIQSIKELLQYPEAELLRIRNCGRVTVNNIKQALAKVGLSLSPYHGWEKETDGQ